MLNLDILTYVQNTPVAQTRSVGRPGSHLHLVREGRGRNGSSCGGRGQPWEALLAKPGQRVRDFIVHN